MRGEEERSGTGRGTGCKEAPEPQSPRHILKLQEDEFVHVCICECVVMCMLVYVHLCAC